MVVARGRAIFSSPARLPAPVLTAVQPACRHRGADARQYLVFELADQGDLFDVLRASNFQMYDNLDRHHV